MPATPWRVSKLLQAQSLQLDEARGALAQAQRQRVQEVHQLQVASGADAQLHRREVAEALAGEETKILQQYTESVKDFHELDHEIEKCDSALEKLEETLGGYHKALTSRA